LSFVDKSLKGERIAYLTGCNNTNVIANWAAWLCGGVAVPLCNSHPLEEQQYFLEDAGAAILIG